MVAEEFHRITQVAWPEDQSFLAAGGDSLVATRVAAAASRRLGRHVRPSDVLRAATPAGVRHSAPPWQAAG